MKGPRFLFLGMRVQSRTKHMKIDTLLVINAVVVSMFVFIIGASLGTPAKWLGWLALGSCCVASAQYGFMHRRLKINAARLELTQRAARAKGPIR